MRSSSDVASIDAIVTALYVTISGPAGAKDWDRERNLFHPAARLMRGAPNDDPRVGVDPTPGLQVMSSDQFISLVAPRLETESFHEYETGREVFQFGRWAHVISAYASSRSRDEPPFARGINSIQLWYEQDRWWVMTVLWDWEGGGAPVPPPLRGDATP